MRRPLSTLLLIGALLWTSAGCARRAKQPPVGPIAANGFMKLWGASLDLRRERDEADRIFLRNDLVLLYTKKNRVYTFAAQSGELLSRAEVGTAGTELRPPVLIDQKIIIPTISTLEVYDRKGRRLESMELDRATRSPAAVQGPMLYIGMDYVRGGRLVKLDMSKQFGRTIWELMTFGSVSAAPAVFEDGIYAASEDGGVYAMAANRDPLWTIDGGVFKTAGGIVADVKVDEFGVYVASTDGKLYCIDRLTGRIRWSYFAGTALRTPPTATVDRVYQWVTGKGIVAINKIEGKTSREPVWVAPGTRHFLSEDESNVYVLSGDQSITALDKVDGQPRFRSRRHDIHISTVNHSSSTIYVATRRGEVLAVKPVLQAGTVGQVVMNRDLQMRDAVAQSK